MAKTAAKAVRKPAKKTGVFAFANGKPGAKKTKPRGRENPVKPPRTKHLQEVVAINGEGGRPVGLFMSIAQAAEEFGSTRETIAKRLSNAGINAKFERGGYAVYRLRDFLRALIELGEDGQIDPTKFDPHKRKAHFQAEAEKFRLEAERGMYLDREDVKEEQARVNKIIAHFFETLPDVLERDAGLAPSMVATVERVLDQVRVDMVSAMQGEESNAGVRASA